MGKKWGAWKRKIQNVGNPEVFVSCLCEWLGFSSLSLLSPFKYINIPNFGVFFAQLSLRLASDSDMGFMETLVLFGTAWMDRSPSH